jgi:hypothetical protein
MLIKPNAKNMKTSINGLVTVAGAVASLVMTMPSYGDVYFNVGHNTGTSVLVETTGDGADVGYTAGMGVAYAPCSELWCEFFNGGSPGSSDVRAYVDSTYPVHLMYYIGYFQDGGDAWLNVD